MSETASPTSKIYRTSGLNRLAFGVFGRMVRTWQDSLQYEDLDAFRNVIRDASEGCLLLLWHNRLFPCVGALMRIGLGARRIHALVSPSRDGAQLAQFLETQGLHPVRGSSSRRGAVAARELVGLLAAGDHVAITVDGPRGPCYQSQAGAALMIQHTEAPIVLLGAECESCRTLDSWDKFLLPAPFSRVKIKVDRLTTTHYLKGREGRATVQNLIQAKLTSLTADVHRMA